MADLEILQVMKSLKSGGSPLNLDDEKVYEYLSRFVLKHGVVPLYFRKILSEIIRDPSGVRKRRRLIKFLAENFGCAAFVLGKESLYLSGISFLLEHEVFWDLGTFKSVLAFLDDEGRLWGFMEKNVSLHPVLVVVNPKVENRKFLGASFLSVEVGDFENRQVVGLLGPVNINYDLAIPLLKYLGEVFV